jgi:hypothetical protein
MKNAGTYELAGGDDGAYGPFFGPLPAVEAGEVESEMKCRRHL